MSIVQKTKAETSIVVESQAFFRINQPAVNNGDIFRIDQTVRAIVVGSESDFSEYTLYYYDPVKELSLNIASITVDQPWIGRIDARLTDQISGTECFGELYITPKNLYLPSRFQTPQQGSTGFVQVWAPNIDLIAYTDDPPAIPDKRALRRISTALQIEGNGKNNYLYLPVYGRKNWTFRLIRADNGATSGACSVRPVKFVLPDLRTTELWGTTSWLGSFANEGEIAGGTFNSEDAKAFAEYVTTAGHPGGRFDYLEFRIDANTNDPAAPGGGSLQGGWQVLFEAYD